MASAWAGSPAMARRYASAASAGDDASSSHPQANQSRAVEPAPPAPPKRPPHERPRLAAQLLRAEVEEHLAGLRLPARGLVGDDHAPGLRREAKARERAAGRKLLAQAVERASDSHLADSRARQAPRRAQEDEIREGKPKARRVSPARAPRIPRGPRSAPARARGRASARRRVCRSRESRATIRPARSSRRVRLRTPGRALGDQRLLLLDRERANMRVLGVGSNRNEQGVFVEKLPGR